MAIGQGFVCSLAIDEMVIFGLTESDINWEDCNHIVLSPNLYRVQGISEKQLVFRHHLIAEANIEEGRAIGRVIKRPSTFNGIKCYIDRLGKICKAND